MQASSARNEKFPGEDTVHLVGLWLEGGYVECYIRSFACFRSYLMFNEDLMQAKFEFSRIRSNALLRESHGCN